MTGISMNKGRSQVKKRSQKAILARHARRWLYTFALPFWAGQGMDPHTGGCVEALDHTGKPLLDLPRRVRTHPRQAYVFASASESNRSGQLALAKELFRFTMACFHPRTDRLASVTSCDGEIVETAHELYDLAFVILAASALTAKGIDLAPELRFLKQSLDELKAAEGWYENPMHAPPRRQVSHMHLFKASLEMYAATGQSDWRDVAEECLDLFITRIAVPDGSVREYFDADWRPITGGQRFEPGHSAEWLSLLHRYECVTEEPAGADMGVMFQYLLHSVDVYGLLPDCTDPLERTRRLWPQTSFLKALLALRHYGIVHPGCSPETVLNRIFSEYLTTRVTGGWYDQRSSEGKLISDRMPSSSLYHVYCGLDGYLSQAGRRRAAETSPGLVGTRLRRVKPAPIKAGE